MLTLLETSPLAAAVLAAVRTRAVPALERLLRDNPGLCTATVERSAGRASPHFEYPLIWAVVDWPGHFPHVRSSIAVLVAAGADVNARCAGPHRETALHAAASCDD